MTEDLTTVVIPAHNAERFIAKAVKSVLVGNSTPIEVIVVDDGSTDGTAHKLNELCAADARTRVITHARSRGPSAARNSALREARGAWVALLDADDTWCPSRLSPLLAEAQLKGLDVIADNQTLIDFDTGMATGRAFPAIWMESTDLLSVEALISKDWPGRQRCRPLGNLKPVLRRTFLERTSVFYDETVVVGEDFLFYVDLLLHGARFGFSSSVGYNYFIRQGSASHQGANSLRQLMIVNEAVASRCETALKGDSLRLASLRKLLHGREQAIRYQLLAHNLKMGDVRASLSAAVSMRLDYAGLRLARAALTRLGIWKDDAIQA